MNQGNDDFYMGEALKEAQNAFAADEVPIGAAGSVLDLVRETRLRRQIQVTAGVKEEDCRRILQDFFQQKRIRTNIAGN